MKRKYALSDLERFIDGECSPEEARQIRADIDGDPSLAREVHHLEEVDRLVRSRALETRAPETLRDSVAERFGLDSRETDAARSPRRTVFGNVLSRRAVLTGAGGLMAAGLATFFVAPRVGILTGADTDPVGTFFRDFETYLLKDRAMDIAETDIVRLAGWFSDRVTFSLPPISSAKADARLVGGRLCWLLERRLASLSYETSDGPFVFYVMNADGIDLPAGRQNSDIGENLSWHRSGTNTSLMWKSDDLLIVMVGTQELHKLMTMARSLVG